MNIEMIRQKIALVHFAYISRRRAMRAGNPYFATLKEELVVVSWRVVLHTLRYVCIVRLWTMSTTCHYKVPSVNFKKRK